MGVVERELKHEFLPMEGDGVLVCRCEEITRGEIRRAVHQGIFTMTEMRRFLRCGMGLCQGQTCARNVKSLIARELGVSGDALRDASARSPLRPVEMSVWSSSDD